MVRWAYKLVALTALCFAGAPMVQAAPGSTYQHYHVGDTAAPTPDPVSGGLLLLGGGDEDPDAMRWFFEKAGHGHIVILRASMGGEDGEAFYHGFGGVASVETFVFRDRDAAYDRHVLRAIAEADGIFIAGGDQSKYVRMWKGTPVAGLIDAHVKGGKPLAGTSAGLAILGEALYSAMDKSEDGVQTEDALADPFGPNNTIDDDFLHIDQLRGILTDTHFMKRDRLGRLFAFVAKAEAGRPEGAPAMAGLGVDEGAAVAVEPDGTARVYPSATGGGAWLVDGATLRDLDGEGPLTAAGVRVTGLDAGSTLYLPDRSVERPSFTGAFSVTDGALALYPNPQDEPAAPLLVSVAEIDP